jgi:hypothetical protein
MIFKVHVLFILYEKNVSKNMLTMLTIVLYKIGGKLFQYYVKLKFKDLN